MKSAFAFFWSKFECCCYFFTNIRLFADNVTAFDIIFKLIRRKKGGVWGVGVGGRRGKTDER